MKTRKEKQKTILRPNPAAIFASLKKQIKLDGLSSQYSEYVESGILKDIYKQAALYEFISSIERYEVCSKSLFGGNEYYLGISILDKESNDSTTAIIEFTKPEKAWILNNVLFPVDLDDFQIIMHEDEPYYAKELVSLFEEFDEIL
jgi:hypothetical protein